MHAATYTVMFRSIPQATAVLLWLLGLRRRRFVAFRRNSATVTATAPSFAADHAVWLVAVGGCGFDVYVGGGTVPSYFHQSLLFKTYKFSGVLYDLKVNGRNIGLWNYLRSEGEGL